LVIVDSDEHDEDGHITEDRKMRGQMVEKRLGKLEIIRRESLIPPTRLGGEICKILVVCWGSTLPVAREARQAAGSEKIGVLHFSQVFPLPEDVHRYFPEAEQYVILENNATAQFGTVLHQATGVEFTRKLLKYDGLPFTVEEVAGALKGWL
jgi:2-oxoglutarate ferredoxin oxidoreductase subunit alpha